jgi:hypothetical protein
MKLIEVDVLILPVEDGGSIILHIQGYRRNLRVGVYVMWY